MTQQPMESTQEAAGPPTIRTSQQGWLTELAKAYRSRDQIVIVDDLNVGIDPSSQTILQMGLRSKLSRNDWIAVGISSGIGIVGIGAIVLAVVDPDPTSKLGLLIASGAILTATGGFNAIRILTNRKPPKVRVSPTGIEIEWD
jgi:hypothetical protein